VSKPDPVQRALERIGELRHASLSDQVISELRHGLHNRSNLVIAKAAKVAGELQTKAIVPDLVSAFHHLVADPLRLDKRCAALTEIVASLYELDCDDPHPYLSGLRHVQMEGSFGPPVDAAAKLRGLCAQGLLRTRFPNALDEVVRLLVDREPEARIGAAKALATNGGEAGFLLLKLKVHTGDREPEVLAECFAGLLAAAPERSVTFVGEYVDSGDEAVAEAAVVALGESRNERALELLKDKWQRTVRGPLRHVLLVAMACSRLEPAIAYLLAIAGEASSETAVQAIEVLASYRSSERVRSSLQKVVQERNAAVVTQAFTQHFGA
jgi:HEAT repeat protein